MDLHLDVGASVHLDMDLYMDMGGSVHLDPDPKILQPNDHSHRDLYIYEN